MAYKQIIAALAFGLALCGQAWAQEQNTREALAREVLTLLRAEESVTEMFATLGPVLGQAATQQLRLSQQEGTRFGEILGEEFQSAAPDLIGAMAQAYANNMTEDQLRETVTYLRSPAGQAYINTQDTAESQLRSVGRDIGLRVAARSLERFMREREQTR